MITYNPNQILLGVIISIMVLVFILNKWRYDLVAVSGLLLLVLLRIVPESEALAGFSHPATITVALVLVISHVLTKSGATKWLMQFVSYFTHSTVAHVIILSFIVTVFSMFINNVGALALMMPIAVESANSVKRHPAVLLMPMSFCSLLGGMVTLIGTPPNIIISHYRYQITGDPFKMFDFAPVGGVLAIIGVLFVASVGWRLLKVASKKKDANNDSMFSIESYLTEVKVTKDSKLLDKTVTEVETANSGLDIAIISLVAKKQRYYTVPKRRSFMVNDVLLVEGPSQDIDSFITNNKLAIGDKGDIHWDLLHSQDTDTLEVVIAPNSILEGTTIEQIRFKSKYGINLLGVYRQGRPYRGRIRSFRAQAGDVLLLHGEREQLAEVVASIECYPLAERGVNFGRKKYALHSMLIFLSAIIAVITNVMPLYVAFFLSILLMVFSDILPPKEIYNEIDWPVIVLLAAMIPISYAMETTGLSKALVTTVFNIITINSAAMLLGVLLAITLILSAILNNAATVLLMAPIAKTIAEGANYSADPFFMAVAIGASCAFLSPIGHQNNILVMGPGGYKFFDYWRMGLPLSVLIIIAAVPLILLHWPL